MQATGHDRLAVEPMGSERRSRERFRIEQEVLYRAIDRKRIAQTGSGRIVDISSTGVRFTTRNAFAIGMSVELSVDWPVLLDDSCPMKLMVRGKVIRTGEENAALEIERYEFRTRGSWGLSTPFGTPRRGSAVTELPVRADERPQAGAGRSRPNRKADGNPSAPAQTAAERKPRRSPVGDWPRNPPPVGHEGRCDCGVCGKCLDNARWERVFNEKFADPEYYSAMRTRNRSSLSWT